MAQTRRQPPVPDAPHDLAGTLAWVLIEIAFVLLLLGALRRWPRERSGVGDGIIAAVVLVFAGPAPVLGQMVVCLGVIWRELQRGRSALP